MSISYSRIHFKLLFNLDFDCSQQQKSGSAIEEVDSNYCKYQR